VSKESQAIDQLADQENSEVRVKGVITSTRLLGGICFAVLEDTFGRIQVVFDERIGQPARLESTPYAAEICGVVRRRPPRDSRPTEPNGDLEVLAHAIAVLSKTEELGPESASRRDLLDYFNEMGFTDIVALARALAPGTLGGLDLLAQETGRLLSSLFAPCRWYLVAKDVLHFGMTPGSTADLQRALSGHRQRRRYAGSSLPEDKASWNPPDADDREFCATGSIRLDSLQNADEPNPVILRKKLGVRFLGDALMRGAQLAVRRGDDAQQTCESLLRGETILRALLPVSGNAGSVALARDFPQFALQGKHIQQMASIFPSLGRQLETQPVEEQFSTLWSLLGHEHVKAIFASEQATETLAHAVSANLFPDHGMLRSLTVSSLAALARLTEGFTDPLAMDTIRTLGLRAPNILSSAVNMMDRLKAQGADWARCEPLALRGVSSELAFAALAGGSARLEGVLFATAAIAGRFAWIFANRPITDTAILSDLARGTRDFPWLARLLRQMEPERAAFDAVHITFGDGLVDYDSSSTLFAGARDCCGHWQEADIGFGGNRWDAEKGRLRLNGFFMYPSKNRAAILAKSCSGICSARDQELFHRVDHFQFTLVEADVPGATGTVQLYTCHDDSGSPVWLVRGLNPSEKSALQSCPLEVTLEVLDAVASLAYFNGISAVLIADGAGLFNGDSTRLPVRAVIRGMTPHLRPARLAVPLRMFSFHGNPVEIQEGWHVWP
jgi:hypothetical protein